MKTLESTSKTAEIEARLNKYAYLSKNTLPGYPDAKVFAILDNSRSKFGFMAGFPDRHNNPHFYHWFIIMKQFSSSTINKWIDQQKYFDQDDSLINQFVRANEEKKIDGESHQQGKEMEKSSPKSDNDPVIMEYTIDVVVKGYKNEQLDTLRKMLESYKAEVSQPDPLKGRLFRIVCKIESAELEKLQKKISNYVQYDELSVKRKVVRGKRSFDSPNKNNG